MEGGKPLVSLSPPIEHSLAVRRLVWAENFEATSGPQPQLPDLLWGMGARFSCGYVSRNGLSTELALKALAARAFPSWRSLETEHLSLVRFSMKT